jgi:hypothetical protein
MRWHKANRPYLAALLTIVLTLFTAGQAFAWQYDRQYASGLWGSATGKSWSPVNWRDAAGVGYPRLQANFLIDNANQRATQPYAKNVRWTQQAVDWMRQNSGTISITFHSSLDGNTGPTGTGTCSNWWQAVAWGATNLPGGRSQVVKRNCSFTWANEVRILGDKMQIPAGADYWAQAWFQEVDPNNNPKGQFNVDTYWDGNENYHQKYCIATNGNAAVDCPVN